MGGVSPLRSRDPRRVGPYRLQGVLGSGGQGTVYLARDAQGMQVAVKVLHAGAASDERAMHRFLEEVNAARRVAPFCTSRILDVAVADAMPYIVSEYIPGESLRELIEREGPREAGALERLAINTASALAAIHQAGIVHRDFKPGNILMGPDGPRVIDFGIARALDRLTAHSSVLVGTPVYMSPEQIAGHPVGPASDMFSWGVTLTYAATGVPAFGDDSVPAVMNRILSAEPDLSMLPHPLREVVGAALAKEPDSRPSAADILPKLLVTRARPALELPMSLAIPSPLADNENTETATVTPSTESAGPASAQVMSLHATETRTAGEKTRSGPHRRTVILGALSAVVAGGGATGAYFATRPQGSAFAHFDGLLADIPSGVLMVAFSPDGKTLASANADGTIGVWAMNSGHRIATLAGHQSGATAVAYSPDGRTLVSGGFDNTVRLWDLPGGQPQAVLTGHTDAVWSVSFSPNGTSIASGSVDRTVRLWDTTSRRQYWQLNTGDIVFTVAFSPDSKSVAFGSADRAVHLWDVTNGHLAVLSGHAGNVRSVAFSPDGKTLASGSFDATVRLWDVTTQRNTATLTGHTADVSSLAYAPHAALLLSGSMDGTARLWNLHTRTTVTALDDPTIPGMPNGEVNSVAYSPDGTVIAIGTFGGHIDTWRVQPSAVPTTMQTP